MDRIRHLKRLSTQYDSQRIYRKLLCVGDIVCGYYNFSSNVICYIVRGFNNHTIQLKVDGIYLVYNIKLRQVRFDIHTGMYYIV